jgi:xanthine/CO dehydrogenase XdhC/CoxF family maturation factor
MSRKQWADGPLPFADDYQRGIDRARDDETERCALLCKMRGDIARESAAKFRKDGTFRGLFGGTHIAYKWEKAARDMEAVGKAFDAVAHCIRMGYDPRELERKEREAEKINLMQQALTPEQAADLLRRMPGGVPLDHWTPCPKCPAPMDCGSWRACERGQC